MSILTKLLLAKKRPKLGIQLPNAGDDNQSYRLLRRTISKRQIFEHKNGPVKNDSKAEF